MRAAVGNRKRKERMSGKSFPLFSFLCTDLSIAGGATDGQLLPAGLLVAH